VVLAGGHGRRFGSPKAWASLPDGRTFLEACCHCLQRAGAEPVVATLPPDGLGSSPAGITTCTLPAPSLPMFDALRMAARLACETTAWEVVVVLPVDHPLVRVETIRALARPAARAILPVYAGRRGHPVALSRAVADGIASGTIPGPTLRDVIRREGWVEVEVADPGIHANCNTPEALTEALEVVGWPLGRTARSLVPKLRRQRS
jgi:molybdenum cofactor cytidylyltransferase